MLQFFDMDNEMEPSGKNGVFGERVPYMFRAPSIVAGHENPYADGGGPELLPNQNRGPRYAERTADSIRTAGGTPLDIRMDGPGFDAKDVPGGASVPKLQSTPLVPTAEFFRAPAHQPGPPRPAGEVCCQRRGRPRGLPHRHPAAELPGAPRRHRAFPPAERA